MTLIGSSCIAVSDRPPLSREGPEAGPIVVWLWGEHDLSTDDALCSWPCRHSGSSWGPGSSSGNSHGR
jgi:hypothetical protein